jgi:hypothetical protein
MLETYTCERCKREFDEFDRLDRAWKIDHKDICMPCREKLGLTYPIRKTTPIDLHMMIGKTGKAHPCWLCGEDIAKGSRQVQYQGIGKSRRYMHLSCPEWKQVKLL